MGQHLQSNQCPRHPISHVSCRNKRGLKKEQVASMAGEPKLDQTSLADFSICLIGQTCVTWPSLYNRMGVREDVYCIRCIFTLKTTRKKILKFGWKNRLLVSPVFILASLVFFPHSKQSDISKKQKCTHNCP